ncbi:hypothetical protein GCM10010467_19620 [Actinocorallia glomerata]|uniref:Uncharacterized protein n=3 Tax=Actinomycetota TaxID=201174 RepID=A0ABP6LY69_9MICC
MPGSTSPLSVTTAAGLAVAMVFTVGFSPAPPSSADGAIEGGEVILDEGLTAPAEEAESISEEIAFLDESPDLPVLTVYDVRHLEESIPGELQELDTATAAFPYPEGCAMVAETVLDCDSARILLEGAIVDAYGQLQPGSLSAASGEILLSTETTAQTAYPLTFTMFLADAEGAELVEDAIEATAWMIATADEDLPVAELDEEERLLNEGVDDEDLDQEPHEEQPRSGSASAPVDDVSSASLGLLGQPGFALIVPAGFTRPSKVSIPSGYRYCPNTCKPKALHDYCTYSPDYFYKASFKGPCARHDMKIDQIRKKNISLASKRSQRASADTTFKSQMRQNCGNAYYRRAETPDRKTCYSRASVYYSIVDLKTKAWKGN